MDDVRSGRDGAALVAVRTSLDEFHVAFVYLCIHNVLFVQYKGRSSVSVGPRVYGEGYHK